MCKGISGPESEAAKRAERQARFGTGNANGAAATANGTASANGTGKRPNLDSSLDPTGDEAAKRAKRAERYCSMQIDEVRDARRCARLRRVCLFRVAFDDPCVRILVYESRFSV